MGKGRWRRNAQRGPTTLPKAPWRWCGVSGGGADCAGRGAAGGVEVLDPGGEWSSEVGGLLELAGAIYLADAGGGWLVPDAALEAADAALAGAGWSLAEAPLEEAA